MSALTFSLKNVPEFEGDVSALIPEKLSGKSIDLESAGNRFLTHFEKVFNLSAVEYADSDSAGITG